MQNIVEKIVNIDKNEIIPIGAVAGDINTRFINFRFISNSKIINLKDTHVRIYAKTANYNEVFNELKIIDEDKGIAQLELTNTLLTPGVTRYELKIMPSSGGTLSTNIMELHVSKALTSDFDPSDTNEYQAFELNLQKMDQYDSRLKDAEDNIKANETNLKNLTDQVNSKSKTALWTGHRHMLDDETITLSKPISKCQNGIVLVWADFDDGTTSGVFNDFNWVFNYVPKNSVAIGSGGNILFQIPINENGSTCVKTLTITDTQIVGNATNRNKTDSNNTNDVVLREVLEY